MRPVVAGVADKIASVPRDRWSAPSPCPDWSAPIAKHVIESQGVFGLVGREMGDLPSPEADLLAAERGAGRVQHDLDDPQLAGTEFSGFFGKSTFEGAAVNRFLCTDLVVHGWDPRAAGLDDDIAPGDLSAVQRPRSRLGDAMRSPRAFGPAVEPPPGADEQTKVLAFLGPSA